MKSSKIAIFIDVENLTQWVKEVGPEKLLAKLSSLQGKLLFVELFEGLPNVVFIKKA